MRAPILNVVYNKYAFDVKNPTGAGIPKTPPPPELPKPTALQPSAPLKLPAIPAPIPAGQQQPAVTNPAAPTTPTLSLARPNNSFTPTAVPDNSFAQAAPPPPTTTLALNSPAAGPPTPTTTTMPTTSSASTTIVSGAGTAPAATNEPKPTPPAVPVAAPQNAQADITTRLGDQNIPEPERRQMAQQHVQQLMDSRPELKQGLTDLHAGKDTPEARAFQAEIDKSGHNFIREEFAKRRAEKPDASPQEQGSWLNDITQSYQSMPTEMKWMMGLGVGGGLLGILGSLFGGGGGMGLLGLLGLGVGGAVGAAGGMFGQGAQNFMTDRMIDAGQFVGAIPSEKIDTAFLTEKDPVEALLARHGGSGGISPAAIKAKLDDVMKKKQQLDMFLSKVPEGARGRVLERVGTGITAENSGQALQNLQLIQQQLNDPKSRLGTQLQRAQGIVDNPWTGYPSAAMGVIGDKIEALRQSMPDAAAWAGTGKTSGVHSMNWWKGAEENNMDIKKLVDTYLEKDAGSPAWQRAAGKNDEGGLNAKGRAIYNKATGGNLKAPVTESNPKGDRAKRQNSFCSRMCGMKKHETGSDTKKDPDSRINKSLRKWNCKCSAAMEFGEKMARCWAGYEPVPGAKKFSKGSCRPKGSKKTQKEMKNS